MHDCLTDGRGRLADSEQKAKLRLGPCGAGLQRPLGEQLRVSGSLDKSAFPFAERHFAAGKSVSSVKSESHHGILLGDIF